MRAGVIGAVAALAALGASVAAVAAGPPFVGPTLTHPAVAPDFALHDQSGKLVRLSAERGKVVVITFLYTHCPDLCPLTAQNIDAAVRTLGRRGRQVTVIAVSVDPAGDTPRAVKRFVREHRLLPQFHYLSGSRRALEGVWAAYHVQSVKHAGDDVDHSLYTLLLDRKGKGRVLFDATATAKAIAHDAGLLLG